MTPPSVFIVILQYNNVQDTICCLNSVKNLAYPNFKAIVIDNASAETEKNVLREYVKNELESLGKISLVVNSQNLGYAGGNNVGIKYALSQGADYVLILNNDTTVKPNLLEKLVQVTEEEKAVGIVGPAIKEPGRTVYFGKISWLKPELFHSTQPPKSNYLKTKEYTIGAAMLIKKEVLEKIEGFDEVFFLYFEDADFSWRAQQAGFKLRVVPEAVVHHQVSRSTTQLGSPLILRYHMRNALLFNSFNAPWSIRPFLIFWAGYVVIKNIVKMFIWPVKEPAADAIIEGVLDFYKNRFGKINV